MAVHTHTKTWPPQTRAHSQGRRREGKTAAPRETSPARRAEDRVLFKEPPEALP